MVIAVIPYAEEVFRQLDSRISIDWLVNEGDHIEAYSARQIHRACPGAGNLANARPSISSKCSLKLPREHET